MFWINQIGSESNKSKRIVEQVNAGKQAIIGRKKNLYFSILLLRPRPLPFWPLELSQKTLDSIRQHESALMFNISDLILSPSLSCMLHSVPSSFLASALFAHFSRCTFLFSIGIVLNRSGPA